MMQVFNTWQDLPREAQGAAVAIGNFDGVHLGHLAVLELVQLAAAKHNAPVGVITFDPHPRRYFEPEVDPFQLMSLETRAAALEANGVDRLYQLGFGGLMAGFSPDLFASQVLAQGLGICHIVVGSDFRFGKGRAGNADDLGRLGMAFGFDVTISDLLSSESGQRASSTNIRRALAEGRPEEAAALLGHPHVISGPVQKGHQRGRDLGFATANLGLDGLFRPRFGVYAVRARVLGGDHAGTYLGAASLGLNPTYGLKDPVLETHLFDFAGDIYGETLEVSLVHYLRGEVAFETADALKAAIAQDCDQARRLLTLTPAKA